MTAAVDKNNKGDAAVPDGMRRRILAGGYEMEAGSTAKSVQHPAGGVRLRTFAMLEASGRSDPPRVLAAGRC